MGGAQPIETQMPKSTESQAVGCHGLEGWKDSAGQFCFGSRDPGALSAGREGAGGRDTGCHLIPVPGRDCVGGTAHPWASRFRLHHSFPDWVTCVTSPFWASVSSAVKRSKASCPACLRCHSFCLRDACTEGHGITRHRPMTCLRGHIASG